MYISNLNELFKKKKQNPLRTSSYSRTSSSRPSSASASHPSSASALRPSSASALRPSSASASRPSLFPRPLLKSEDSDLTSSSVDQMNDVVTRRIFSKLDNLKTLLEKVKKNQEDMKEEIKTIKEEAVIIKSAQDLLEKKIYSNYDEFKESAEFFLRESDNEFFSTLGSKWEPYFEKKIRKPLSKRLRSLRSTLCARVKTTIFENFSNMLPPISNVAKASEIAAWKKKLAVSNCFRKLFEKIEDDENNTYMTKIIKNVWPKKKNISNLQIAWAISISEIFLNPKNERKIENEEGFEYESDSSPTPQRPVSPERQKDPEKQIEPERNKGKKRIIEVKTLRKNLKKSKRKVENNEYEGKKNDEYEGDEGEEEGFEYESDSSPTPQRPVSPERQKDPEKQIEPERNKGKKRIIEVKTLRKNLKKSKRKVENNEYEGKKNDEYEGDEGEEGEEDDEGDEGEDDDDEDEEYHNEIKDPEKQIEPERNKGKKRIIEVKTLRKNLKKSKRKVENNEYEGKKNDEYEGDEGEEGEEDDEGDEGEDDDDEDEEYHNEIVNIESED
ncbi:hypothetical protein Glove_586g5 [Diversispora epigaea]|uniref:Uncharacterized protein n=1 Tax=Diversispora epigaea TaxID=1348612 RepID=A0A397G8D4_9GLOM|nr:hypothetical protein Glove_586g5 [Diversispora epigaea]